MPAISGNNQATRVQTKIAAVSASSEACCFLLPNTEFPAGISSTVANIGDLPVISTNNIPNGTIIFVDSISVPVVASNEQWIGLDGRLLRSDIELRQIYSWGLNGFGQLGDGTTITRSSPVSVVGGITDWCVIAAGSAHSLAIRTNGTAWSWGGNGQGRLGDGTATARSSPVSVIGGFTDWCAIAAGGGHSLAIRANGTAWAWGYNTRGTLGDGTVTTRSSPVSVVGGISNWCAIAAGNNHNLAIRADGTVWAWGYNGSGRLGDGTVTARSSPVAVVGGFTDWCAIAAGGGHSLAIRTNGTAWSWGENSLGQLGDGTYTGRLSPVSVIGGISNWCVIAAGSAHSLAIRANGTAWAWGYNTRGTLGDGTTAPRPSPVAVVGGIFNWCAIAGSEHSLAIRANGTAWAWGYNGQGRLGDNTVFSKRSPVIVVGGFDDWMAIAAGSGHSAAIRNSA